MSIITHQLRSGKTTPVRVDPPIIRQPVSALTPEWRDQWLRLFQDDDSARIHAHPALVELRHDAQLLGVTSGSALIAAAALLPEVFPIGHHLLPGSPKTLTGFRLAGDQLLAADDESTTSLLIAGIADELKTTAGQLVEFEDVAIASALYRDIIGLRRQGFFVCTPLPPTPHYRLHLPNAADEYWSRFSTKTRSTMRRRRRKLDGTLRQYTQPSEVDEFLALAHPLSLKTWQWQDRGLCVPHDDDAIHSRRQLAELGAWRAYLLCVDGQPVAYVDGTQLHSTYSYNQPGYDPDWSKFGPGRVLITEIIDDLYAEGSLRTFDFGAGHMPYKAEFADDIETTATLWLLPPGVASWRIVQSLHWRQRLHRTAKKVLHSIKLMK